MEKIVLVGFKSSGKSTVGKMLVQRGYHALSFADALKDAVAAIFCWDRDLVEGETDESRSWREEVDTWWSAKLGIPGLTPRWVLQNIGTNVMREHFHPDIWINNVERRILNHSGPVVVTDGRFPNEIDLVRGLGGISIRVKRGPEPSWFGVAQSANSKAISAEFYKDILKQRNVHPSEYSWVGHHIDHTIDNSSDMWALKAALTDIIGE